MDTSQTVWITGAGSGIGAALCVEYARLKYTVILSGRKVEALEHTAQNCRELGAKTIVVPFDLTDMGSLPEVVSKVRNQVNHINILINNGGVSQRSLVAETPLEIDRKIFETNYFGTIAFTKAVLPWMVETGGGVVSVVSSISGLFGFPLRSSYAASKHALSGYFETIGLEYIQKGIHTTIIFPGRIRTELSKSALTASGDVHNSMDKGQRDGMPVEVCARKIVRAIKHKKRRVLIGRKELLLAYIHKYFHKLFWVITPRVNPK